MYQNSEQISFLSRVFNVHPGEWSRIALAWLIRFFYRYGFVVGWTVLVAMFASHYGIYSLPYLLVLAALFTVLGSLIYSTFLGRVRVELLLIGSVFATGALLYLAIQMYSYSLTWFFSLLIVAIAVFLNQFKIILNSYVEEMFTPLESERAFPLIEAADTFAGIFAGITVLSLANNVETVNMIYLWAAAVFLTIPFILYYENFDVRVTLVVRKRRKRKAIGIVAKFKKAFSCKDHISYIRGLFGIVFFQWFLFNLLEFQYTKAVYQNVSGLILDAGSGFQHAFVHDLGILFLLFSASALLVQLFFGSRLLDSLGVFGTMLIHPIVTFLSFIGMIWNFNYASAVLAKNNYTITSVLHNNAYHSSYYAIKHDLREYVRELLEGVVRPFGAIFGTVTLILLQRFFTGPALILAINLAMVKVVVIIFVGTYLLQRKYTRVAIHDLLHSKDRNIRINAIDILSQKGHRYGVRYLKEVLLDKSESVSIKAKVLRALAELQEVNALPSIISCLNSKYSAIKNAALDTLASYKVFRNTGNKAIFAKYHLESSLKRLYLREDDSEIISKIIYLMSSLGSVSTIEFLHGVLKHSDLNHRCEAMLALAKYGDENISVFLEPFLQSKMSKERICTAIALFPFEDYREDSLKMIHEFLHSDKSEKKSLALYAIGELGLSGNRKICRLYLKSKDKELKSAAAIALAKMSYRESIAPIVDLLFSQDESFVKEFKLSLRSVSPRILKKVNNILERIASSEVEKVLQKRNADSLLELDNNALISLRKLYHLLGEYGEVEMIDGVLALNRSS
ncbi:MAG: HEAT repeat domain-containing protein [bacterium]|nr:HEAT repeat domain-containing protein [bacterium]